jgi:hypothetical protein
VFGLDLGLDFGLDLGADLVADLGADGFGDGAALFEFGEWAVVLIVNDGVGDGIFAGPGAAEVISGDLEAVEEQPGALGVDGVAGDAADDLGERELDGCGVVESVEACELEAGLWLTAAMDRLACAVEMVVVAEVLSAEGGRATAAAVGEDVAAEVGLALGQRSFGGLGKRTFGLLRRVDFDEFYDG